MLATSIAHLVLALSLTPELAASFSSVETIAEQSASIGACEQQARRQNGVRNFRDHSDDLGRAPRPEAIHVSMPQEPGAGALAFSWMTDYHTLASQVQIGFSPGEWSHTIEGESFNFRGINRDRSDSRRVHEVHVCGLPAGRYLYYRVGGEGAWSDASRVRVGVAPGANERWTAVLTGDSRSNRAEWAAVAAAIAEVNPDVLLLNGDLVGDGRVQRYWDWWFEDAADLFASTVVLPVPGNHEYDALNFEALFALPRDEENFIFQLGRLTILGFDDYFSPEAMQRIVRPRLLGMLNEVRDAERLMVINHQPWYSTGDHGSDRHLRGAMLDLLDAWVPELVVNGHDHHYERSYPIRYDERAADGAPGTTFVVSAGAGANLHDGGDAWFSAVQEATHHFLVMEVEGLRIQIEARRLDGSVIERFVIDEGHPTLAPRGAAFPNER